MHTLMGSDEIRTRLAQIDRLLADADDEALVLLVTSESQSGLLSDNTLDLARAMGLASVVIYLATLITANNPRTSAGEVWLTIYQSIRARAETADFQCLLDSNPLKWVARCVISGCKFDVAPLDECDASLGDLGACFELACDARRFDIVQELVEYLVPRQLPAVVWLHIGNLLVEREQFIAKSYAGTAPLARSYMSIRAALIGVPGISAVASALALAAARCSLGCEDYSHAIQSAMAIEDPRDELEGFGLLAEASCKSGDYIRSAGYLDKQIRWLTTPSQLHQLADAVIREDPTRVRSYSFEPEAASHALGDLQRILEADGHRMFLMSGTLLGFVRNGQLLPHDKDIDVGVMAGPQVYGMFASLLASGLFALDMTYIDRTKLYHVPIVHRQTNTYIDIFIHHPRGNKQVTGVRSYLGFMQFSAYTAFTLESADFNGLRVYVPNDIDRNLRDNFGDSWRIPDPDYLSLLEQPALMHVGGLGYQLRGRLTIRECLAGGKPSRLSRAVQLMRNCRTRPGGVTRELIDTLRVAQAMLATELQAGTPASGKRVVAA